ncbi:MAG: 30S ribosomal protein S12 methylthiotransferase RimO [Clostridia bacterium]|nr:30S ribosomal protein S12 methylthiotransferase RimO [Clostridia bacterium]
MEKVSVISLGCAKNLTDAEVMLSRLEKGGYEITYNEREADIIIVNTCAFIDSAKQESIDTVLDVADLKKDAKLKLLIVAGCMGQRFSQEVLDELPEVDGVCGTGDFDDIVNVIKKVKDKRGAYLKGTEYACLDTTDRILATPPYTAYLKIAEGCSNHCTYCVIPKIRGKYKSRDMESILSEAELLVQNGVKELVLIAQDTSCYGKDLYGKNSLTVLLRKLSEIKNLEWIRVHYLYPEGVTDELIEEFKTNDKLVKYFDIPVQHISDNILKKMARRTDSGQIKTLLEKIRTKVSGAVIRTSLIVGFPGETDEDFYKLYDFLKEYKLDRVGVFAYSREDTTPAAGFENQVDEQTKLDRKSRLEELLMEITEQKNQQKIGKTVKVLVEGKDKVLKMYYGRTYADSIDVDPKVFFKSDEPVKEGEFIQVKYTDYIDCDMIGEIL